ncbi:hypothetical protein [Adhaeretor mobilis]|nr:hypothetical protein [Adhaeretor mobilis]
MSHFAAELAPLSLDREASSAAKYARLLPSAKFLPKAAMLAAVLAE